MPLNFHTHSSKAPRQITHRSLMLILTFFMLAGAVVAQGEQETKLAAAEKPLSEALQLLAEKSDKESLEQAIRKFEEVRAIVQSLKDTKYEALILGQIAAVYVKLGDKQKTLDYFKLSLPLWQTAGFLQGEVSTLLAIGKAYADLGNQRDALDYYERALPLIPKVNNKKWEAIALYEIGTISNQLGDRQKGLDYLKRALPLLQDVKDRNREAMAITNIGGIYYVFGEKQKALDNFTHVITSLSDASSERKIRAFALAGKGSILSELGEPQMALDYLTQALSILSDMNDRMGQSVALNNIGGIYFHIEEKRKAIEFFEQALVIARDMKDRTGEVAALNNIGISYFELGERQIAIEYFTQAQPLVRDLGVKKAEAALLHNMGVSYYGLNDKQKAFEYTAQALKITQDIGDRENEVMVLYMIAALERDRGNLAEARARIETAIPIVESLRTKIVDQQLRSSYFATQQDRYALYIDVLMLLHKQQPDKGYDGLALQSSERARARNLIETLTEANADIREGVDPVLVERERALHRRLNAKADNQIKLITGAHTKEQAEAITKEIEALTSELRQVEGQIRQSSPRYAALTQPQPLTLKEVQTQLLDADTLLLEYSLGEHRSYLWAVAPDSITSYTLPNRKEIETAARRAYDLLNARNKRIEGETPKQQQARISRADVEYADASAQLSRMVLEPAAKHLGTKRLLIVSDGALQYIPFASLPDPNSAGKTKVPLVVRHEIVSLPSASTLAVLRRELKDRKPAAKALAVLADPVFDETDERVKDEMSEAASGVRERRRPREGRKRELPLGMVRSAEESGLLARAGLTIPRLPGTRLEADHILSLVPATESKRAFDFAANRATATSPILSQYRYVHFATHGILNSLHPELSGIVLSMVDEKGNAQDGFLRAHEVFNLKLPAELVVLSACQTGLGKEIKGEGLVGLTRGFMYAGAPRVVVSLWSVSDAATAELMKQFYRGMLKEGKRPAAALRSAQISLINDKRWSTPFYWAAFTLQGEWR